MGLRDFTLFDVVQRNACLYADRLAFVFEKERVTHGAYLARVERLAAGLARAVWDRSHAAQVCPRCF